MEWKPKSTNPVLAQGTGSSESMKVGAVPVEGHTPTPSASSNLDSKDATSELERKLEESHIADDQHVIIPNHLHVPEAEKLGFCFGSFDASFGFNASSSNGPMTDKSSEASEEVDESIEEQSRFVIFYVKLSDYEGPLRFCAKLFIGSEIKMLWQLLMKEIILTVLHPLVMRLRIYQLKVTSHQMQHPSTENPSKRLHSQLQAINTQLFKGKG